MGIDAGFDMVPRLSKGVVDRHNWESFIRRVKERYKDDELVEAKPNYLEFNIGEHPLLPFEGHKFLRFSSKLLGSHTNGVMKYIETVTMLAQLSFGSRARYWSEATDQWGFYNWNDVNDSFKSYEQPDELEIPTTIAQFVLGTDPIAELGVQLFEVKSVPGKGRGLVAPFNIAKGKRIISEKPLFTTHNISQPGVMEINVAAKLRALSKPEQRQFLSLHNNFPGKNPFGGIVKTNALPCGPDSIVGGIYPTICLINHSCLPNAHNSWNSNTNCETIHATRFIPAGEEITIPYDKGGPSSVRQAQLKEGFGFICTCNLCSLPPTMLQASDARRLEIQRLDDAIGDPTRVLNKPADSLVDCQSLLKVLQEEYNGNPGILLARLYYDAFQISITHSDQARASIFAGRGYNARVAYEGEDSPETARIKGLMEHPAGHASYGASKRWRTSKGMVPKGLDAEEFERWLWRV